MKSQEWLKGLRVFHLKPLPHQHWVACAGCCFIYLFGFSRRSEQLVAWTLDECQNAERGRLSLQTCMHAHTHRHKYTHRCSSSVWLSMRIIYFSHCCFFVSFFSAPRSHDLSERLFIFHSEAAAKSCRLRAKQIDTTIHVSFIWLFATALNPFTHTHARTRTQWEALDLADSSGIEKAQRTFVICVSPSCVFAGCFFFGLWQFWEPPC